MSKHLFEMYYRSSFTFRVELEDFYENISIFAILVGGKKINIETQVFHVDGITAIWGNIPGNHYNLSPGSNGLIIYSGKEVLLVGSFLTSVNEVPNCCEPIVICRSPNDGNDGNGGELVCNYRQILTDLIEEHCLGLNCSTDS